MNCHELSILVTVYNKLVFLGAQISIQAIQAIQGWCMLLYYPQETVLSMGPTCILSGSQYWTKDTEHMEPWDILRAAGWLMIMGIYGD